MSIEPIDLDFSVYMSLDVLCRYHEILFNKKKVVKDSKIEIRKKVVDNKTRMFI